MKLSENAQQYSKIFLRLGKSMEQLGKEDAKQHNKAIPLEDFQRVCVKRYSKDSVMGPELIQEIAEYMFQCYMIGYRGQEAVV